MKPNVAASRWRIECSLCTLGRAGPRARALGFYSALPCLFVPASVSATRGCSPFGPLPAGRVGLVQHIPLAPIKQEARHGSRSNENPYFVVVRQSLTCQLSYDRPEAIRGSAHGNRQSVTHPFGCCIARMLPDIPRMLPCSVMARTSKHLCYTLREGVKQNATITRWIPKVDSRKAQLAELGQRRSARP